VIFGDDATLQYVVTQATDILLMIPMTYAAVAGVAGWRRMLHHRKRAAAHLRRPRAQRHGPVCAHRRVLVQL
jgi:hypothetical protein